VVSGRVVDFLLFYYQSHYFPAFNVADSAITVGAVLLAFDELRRVRKG
jgi:signal peptidase II